MRINIFKNTSGYFLFFISIFILSLYLFYLQATLQISSDLGVHINFIDQIISGELKLPHEGFQYSVYLLAKLFSQSYTISSVFLLSTIMVIIAYIKFFLLKHLSKISVNKALTFTIGLMLVSAICVPAFNHNFYIGQGSPSVWHNPTLLCIKPFAFVCVYLTILALDSFKFKTWLGLSILLLISFFYKPSFGIVFIPALGLYILAKHTKNYHTYIYFLLMILPSVLFTLIVQLRSWFFSSQTNNSIIWAPLGVLHLYTPNVVISFILATAFPLLFLLCHPKRVFYNRYLFLSWLMLLIGYLQFALLAETQCFQCANFSWGFLITLDLVFVFTFIEFIKWIKETKLTNKSMQARFGVLALVFFTHFISGMVYLGRYITTGIFL